MYFLSLFLVVFMCFLVRSRCYSFFLFQLYVSCFFLFPLTLTHFHTYFPFSFIFCSYYFVFLVSQFCVFFLSSTFFCCCGYFGAYGFLFCIHLVPDWMVPMLNDNHSIISCVVSFPFIFHNLIGRSFNSCQLYVDTQIALNSFPSINSFFAEMLKIRN